MTYGESVTRQATGIGAATGNTADSIVIPAQNVIYTTARNTLKFPAAYQARWSNAYKSTVNFSVTAALYSLNNAAFFRVTATTETDTIAGWGKMRLKTASGVSSIYMDVLAVKTKVHFVDSLMIGSVPAPEIMLTGLGFTQGAATDVYTISWYRTGEVTPLLRVNYFDDSYSTPIDTEAL